MAKKRKERSLGEKLKELRKAKGLSTMETAKAAGINYKTYLGYERGGKTPTRNADQTYEKLASALGCSVEHLSGAQPKTAGPSMEPGTSAAAKVPDMKTPGAGQGPEYARTTEDVPAEPPSPEQALASEGTAVREIPAVEAAVDLPTMEATELGTDEGAALPETEVVPEGTMAVNEPRAAEESLAATSGPQFSFLLEIGGKSINLNALIEKARLNFRYPDTKFFINVEEGRVSFAAGDATGSFEI